MPEKLRKLNTCIFFPYCKNLVELLDQTNLGNYISTLIGTNDTSQIDFAANVILGILQGRNSQNIKNIFEQACSNAQPNPFIKFRKNSAINAPTLEWIEQIVTTSSNNTTYRLQSGRVYLSTASGFEVSASLDKILQVPESNYQEITNTKDLAMLFMRLTSEELNSIDTSLDSSPLGGA